MQQTPTRPKQDDPTWLKQLAATRPKQEAPTWPKRDVPSWLKQMAPTRPKQGAPTWATHTTSTTRSDRRLCAAHRLDFIYRSE